MLSISEFRFCLKAEKKIMHCNDETSEMALLNKKKWKIEREGACLASSRAREWLCTKPSQSTADDSSLFTPVISCDC